MPAGLNLGGAFFSIYGDNEQLLRSMAQAKAATTQATTAMANAQKSYAAAAMSSNASIINMNREVAESWVRTAQVHAGSAKDHIAVLDAYGIKIAGVSKATTAAVPALGKLTEEQKKAKKAADDHAKALAQQAAGFAKFGSTLATLTGFGAIASGALVAREAILGLVEASQKLNQEQFRLKKEFGELAPMYQQQAEALAALSGRGIADATAAINQFATLQKNYGLTTEQIIDLQKRSADAAAVAGVSLEEAAKRVQSALRGEAESIEFLGFSLQSNYLKALQDVNSEEYKHWNTMGQLAKAQKIYEEFQKQSNTQTGAAAERANDAAGAIDKMTASVSNLAGALGQQLNPGLTGLANIIASITDFMAKGAKETAEYDAAFSEFLKERQLPQWLQILAGIFGTTFAAKGNPLVEDIVQRKRAEEQAKVDAAKQVADEKQKRDTDIENTKKHLEELDKLKKLAVQKEIDAENDLYESKKAKLEAAKEIAVQAAEDRKDAALAGIADEKQAAEDLYETQLARLQAVRDAALDAAEARHTSAVRALETEKEAVGMAAEAQQRRIKAQADADVDASQDRLRGIKETLDAEDRLRDAARVQEDRALADQTEGIKRQLSDRHEAVMEGLAAEEKGVRDRYQSESRALEAEGKKIDARHDKAVKKIEDRAKAEDKRHDKAVRNIDQEGDRAEKRHRDILRQISDEADAAEKRHDAITRGLEDEQQAAEDRHDLATRGLKDEEQAAEDRHEAIMRGLDQEEQAAEDAHTAVTRGLDDELEYARRLHEFVTDSLADELDLAKQLHDATMDGLDERKRAEDDRHRQATDNLDEELRRQLAYIDTSLGAVDAEADARARESKMAGLQSTLSKARSGGNASEIAAAERAIQDELADIQHDAVVDQLKAKRDALEAAGRLAKDQADDEHRRIEEAIDDEKRLADAILDGVERSVKARKDAADDAFSQVDASIKARKQQADDELTQIKRGVDARKQAADDELELVKRSVDARKQAADDTLALVKRSVEDRKQAADDELRLIKEVEDQRKQAADDDYQRVKDSLAARKDALDQESKRRQEVFDDEKAKADEKAKREKDALDLKKIQIEDERDSALDALAVRRAQEEDDYQEAQRREEDALKEAQRRIQDRRTTEDQAAQDARHAAEETARIEQEQIKATADAAVLASKDALDAYTRDYDQRKQKADDTYKAEQDQIKLTYDHPETGLIPKLKQSYESTKEWLDKRAQEVNKAYQAERDQIKDTYDHPEHGLFAQLKKIHDETIDGLKDVKKDWEDNFQRPIEEITKATFDDVQKQFDRLLKNNQVSDIGGGGGGGDDSDEGGRVKTPARSGGGGAGPAPTRTDGQYRPVVEGAFSSSYNTSGGTHGGYPAADIFAARGSAIRAPVGGRMEAASYSAGGNAGWLYGNDGLVYYFAHANNRMANGKVDAGDKIGEVGNTGNAASTSPHLHFAIARDADTISNRNGSGDRDVSASYWEGGEGGETGSDRTGQDEVIAGRYARIEGGSLIFTLFGHEYRYKLPSGMLSGPSGAGISGSGLLAAIERLGAEIGGKEFGRVAAAVAASEGADGDLSRQGSGGARGPFQFDPGGELIHFAKALGMSMAEAGDYAGSHPLAAARYALSGGSGGLSGQGYLGRAIKQGQDRYGLSGAALADYASQYGQRPYGDFWRRAGDQYRRLYGYRFGGVIPEPTLLVGQTMGPYAMAGESATEWVTPQAPGEGGGHTTVEMPIMIGNREIERLWIDGYHLNVQRGRAINVRSIPR